MLSPLGRQQETTMTHIRVDDEYWLALRHPAEALTAGFSLLDANHPGFAALPNVERDALWKEFRAYIRQAEGFYLGAAVLPWKSSPLNYYYSFLNLAKAAALARGLLPPQPAAKQRVLRHGISAEVIPGNPDQWSLSVRRPDDVFGLLYSLSLGTAISKGTKLEGHALLNYISPISWQMGKSGYGPAPYCPCYWMLLKGQQPNQVWDVLVVPRAFPIDQMPAPFQALYEEVRPNGVRRFAWEALKLHAVQANQMRFLQRTNPVANPGDIETSIRNAAPYSVQENLDSDIQHIRLYLPYQTGGNAVPISELVAAYAVMYFLSYLVRYHPDYMDRIGESSDSWLIESFAKSVPLIMLRYLASETLGYCLKITSA